MAQVVAPVDLRPYHDKDESDVLGLLDETLGHGPAGARSAAYFRWKHLENPFGRSYMLLAEANGRIVGLRAFMRWRFGAGDQLLRAVRAVDTATHPDFQGQGVFSLLTRRALEDLGHEADVVFNTPNDKSLPGYLKMGWAIVGKVPISVRVCRPLRFARHARGWRRDAEATLVPRDPSSAVAAQVLEDPRTRDLVAERERFEGIATVRDLGYLRWRYGQAPLLDYRAVGEPGRSVAIFRVRPRGALVETTVSELIVRPGDTRAARRALSTVARVTSADHITCTFPAGSTAMNAARRSAFLRVPGGLTLVANPLGHELDPDPLQRSSWGLSAGDLEVF